MTEFKINTTDEIDAVSLLPPLGLLSRAVIHDNSSGIQCLAGNLPRWNYTPSFMAQAPTEPARPYAAGEYRTHRSSIFGRS